MADGVCGSVSCAPAFRGVHKHLVLCSPPINIIPAGVGGAVNSPSYDFMDCLNLQGKGEDVTAL